MGYYIAPRFLDKLSVHITKNYLDLPNVKVPLILGIHGRKGEGKTFMCELVFKRMGIGVVYMSAGELESPDAGDPSRLIRLRYREAGEWSKVNGRMAALMINDVDAGIGRVDETTQYTVNTQLVNATLMNIADNPTNVQLPGSYDQEPTRRIPIILTGNDFSTMYAPLIRDGRMEKFYWEPDRSDRLGIVQGIFALDQIPDPEIEKLVDSFPDQSIDFFGALRSRLYDEQIRQLIQEVGIERISPRVVNSAEPLPEFRRPNFSLPHLIEIGQLMVREQQRIRELRLSEEYNRPGQTARSSTPDGAIASPPAYHQPPYLPEPGSHSSSANGHAAPSEPGSLSPEVEQQLIGLVRQGQRIGLEYADPRHFRNNTWQCYRTIQGNEPEAIAVLSTCLAEHPGDYVRLVGIDPKNRRRLVENIIQRPA
uniref:Ribulose bisphosphate carboxylase small chain n=1 Tax=Cyanothece sp. (strain PCC 7425 / ATCC 29141) TaxID=395961 RepID=B8HYF8_CYAP4